MKYILLLLALFTLASCSGGDTKGTIVGEDNHVDYSHVVAPDVPRFKWSKYYPPYEETFYTTYNSGKIIEVYALMELSDRPQEYINVDTMEMEYEYPYAQNSACTFTFCGRYKILVEYDTGNSPPPKRQWEYVVDQAYVDGPNELIDDSDFYKNK